MNSLNQLSLLGIVHLTRTQTFSKSNISYPLISYPVVRNISFSENFAYVLNEWTPIATLKCFIHSYYHFHSYLWNTASVVQYILKFYVSARPNNIHHIYYVYYVKLKVFGRLLCPLFYCKNDYSIYFTSCEIKFQCQSRDQYYNTRDQYKYKTTLHRIVRRSFKIKRFSEQRQH